MAQKRARTQEVEEELRQLRARVAELEATARRDAATLRFQQVMAHVSSIMRGASDLDAMLERLLDEILDIFDCDRAWLLYPCDPEAPTWGVPVERTRPEWPGVFAVGVELPNDDESQAVFRAALAAEGPLSAGTGGDLPLPLDIAARFGIQSQLFCAVRPKTDRAWLLGIHHCAAARAYSDQDRQIFAGIAQRLAEAVATLVLLRDLRATEKRLRTFVEHAPEAIVLLDGAGQLTDANDKAERLLGRDRAALLGAYLGALSPPVQADNSPSPARLDELLEQALDGADLRFEWTLLGSDGDEIPTEIALVRIDDGGQPRLRGSITDIRQRRALESQVLHLQKMKALGEMAGGVAHDFNNQLLLVLFYADMLRDLDDLDDRIGPHVDRIVHAAEEAAALTRQLLAFSRRSVLRPRMLDLNQVVRETTGMLQRLAGSTVQIVVGLSEEPARVRADAQQLTQVLVNLVSNARDAIQGEGTIEIRTLVTEGDGAVLPAGRQVTLSVRDDGQGMDAATLDRIWEPFFTTKDVGQGTGLGLSTAYGVIQQSGGSILVDSAPGVGSVFTVVLPWVEQGRKEEDTGALVQVDLTGTETILLVEDHVSVAEAARQALATAGYQVMVANHPDQALDWVLRGVAFDLLFTDIVMPGMDGVTLAERVRARRPDVKVLFTTGNSASATERLGNSHGKVHLLEKPYTTRRLLGRVRRVLDR